LGGGRFRDGDARVGVRKKVGSKNENSGRKYEYHVCMNMYKEKQKKTVKEKESKLKQVYT
jgi:hypothetical protein